MHAARLGLLWKHSIHCIMYSHAVESHAGGTVTELARSHLVARGFGIVLGLNIINGACPKSL